MRAKNFVVNRGVSCFIRGVSCFIRGVSCFIRGVSCFIRCILSCFIRCNPVFQSWSSRRERVKICSAFGADSRADCGANLLWIIS